MSGLAFEGHDEPNKQAEIDTARESLERGEAHLHAKPFHPAWGIEPWIKWATITRAMEATGARPGESVLDLGCGEGWTTLFLAEAGFRPTGLDLAPARVEMAATRARRWGSAASFEVGDMDLFDLGRTFDGVLLYDALHHSVRQAQVLRRAAAHLRPGGWIVIGEPSWLHGVSPHARRTSRELGWVERGISVRALRRDCAAAGLVELERVFEPTRPFTRRGLGFGLELARLSLATFAVAPHASVWLVGRLGGGDRPAPPSAV